MAKAKSVFVCNECGYESPKWLGKCPACNSWNTFFEQKIVETKSSATGRAVKEKSTPQVLEEVVGKNESRNDTGIAELNRVLGGGLVNGSLVLLGGEPGIGKSTLILELCDKITGNGKVLYISGEESAEQVKIRADRLGIKNSNIMFLGETDIDVIEETILAMNPKLVIIDSIQTMYSEEITSAAGTVSQVREITARIMRISKGHRITTIIIGHVTKDGNIAGPRVLEHMVDTVLYLEGERYFSYRVLRSVKNRFGSTNEIGMFEMRNEGMVQIKNPSQILISDRQSPRLNNSSKHGRNKTAFNRTSSTNDTKRLWITKKSSKRNRLQQINNVNCSFRKEGEYAIRFARCLLKCSKWNKISRTSSGLGNSLSNSIKF